MNRAIVNRARAFLIWREGQAVNWRCTAQELADALGLNRKTVYRVCSSRGWSLLEDDSSIAMRRAKYVSPYPEATDERIRQ